VVIEPLWLHPRDPGSPGEVWALQQAEMYLQFAVVPQVEAVRRMVTEHAPEAGA